MDQIKFLKFGIARRFRMAQMAFSLRNADFIEACNKVMDFFDGMDDGRYSQIVHNNMTSVMQKARATINEV